MLEKDLSQLETPVYRPVYVEIRRQLTGQTVESASVDYHPINQAPFISIRFNEEGTKYFAEITRRYAPHGESNLGNPEGRRLAIVYDRMLFSSPTLNDQIPDGQAQITGSFSNEEADRLANALNSGSLPLPITFVESVPIPAEDSDTAP